MRAVLLFVVLLVAGCAGSGTTPAGPTNVGPRDVTLQKETGNTGKPLNVSIVVFEQAQQGRGSQASVQDAERRYLATALKRTLSESGYWGAIRVVPRADPGAELVVSGTVLQSDGVRLRLGVRAQDATGALWLAREYEDSAVDHAYDHDPQAMVEPFQDLLNEVANDLALLLIARTQAQYRSILQAATLRYAISLSPESFEEYLAEDENGVLQVQRLPARNDTIFERVHLIREAEHRFIDAVDEQYDLLFSQVQRPYAFWRRYGYELIRYNQRIARDGKGGNERRGYEALKATYQAYQDSRMNEDELRELSSSFDAEVTPIVANVSGQVVELSGSLENQYDEWRHLLRKIYLTERGLPE